MEPSMIFVTDDACMRNGVLDETDKEIIRQAGNGGRVMIVNTEEAVKMAEADKGPKLPRPKKPLAPGLLELKPKDMDLMDQAAAATVQLFQDEVARVMNDQRAAFVRRLRVDQRYTWRKIARTCAEAWHTDWGSNQLAGMAICEHAARRTFEDYRKPPWN